MAEVEFYRGTLEKFKTLSKDEDTLYFLTNGQVYLGNQLLSNHIRIVNSLPSAAAAVAGCIYINLEDNASYYFDANNNRFLPIGNSASGGIEVIPVETLPPQLEEGIIYLLPNGSSFIKSNNITSQLTKEVILNIDITALDTTIPSAKAVYTFCTKLFDEANLCLTEDEVNEIFDNIFYVEEGD